MNGRNQIGLFFMVLSCVLGGVFISNHLYIYSQVPYEIEIIQSHLKLATTTQNIDDKVGYIEDTVKSLSVYHGNGNWWFPTERTDIDQTRGVLASVARDIQAQDDVKDRDGYFVLPHNELVIYLDSQIEKTDKRLDRYASAIYWNPENNIGIWILPFTILGSVLAMSVLFLVGNERRYKEKWEEEHSKD